MRLVSTALLITPQFPQRLDGARPEASGVARPTWTLPMFFQASTLAKLTTLHFPKTFFAEVQVFHVPELCLGMCR